MPLLLVVALSLAGLQAPPRPCDEQAAVMAGGWTASADAGIGYGWHPLTKRYQKQIAPVLDGIAALVRNAYPDPVGSQGKYYRNYTVEGGGPNDATYELTVNFRGYGCDRAGQIKPLTETATWLYVQVNAVALGNIAFETRQHFLSAPEDLGLLTLPPSRVLRTPSPRDTERKPIDSTLPPSMQAFPNFTHEGEYDSTPYSYNTRTVSQVVFLTPDDTLPYDPVSIGEFLDLNEKLIRAQMAADDGTLAEFHRRLLARVAAVRQRYAGQLADPAYIASRHWGERALDEDRPFVGRDSGYLLARRSGRFGSPAAGYQPRFMVVAWRWQPEVPYSVRVHEALKNNLDFAALKAQLKRAE